MKTDGDTIIQVEQFLAHEAALLNRDDWRPWLDLFAEGGMYWMPLAADQTDPRLHVSLIYDDAVMREIRCRRWNEPHPDTGSLSLQPRPRTLRYVTNVLVEAAPGDARGDVAVRANASVMYVEYAREQVRQWFGHATWQLVRVGDAFRIALKRVDLINADAAISDLLAYV